MQKKLAVMSLNGHLAQHVHLQRSHANYKAHLDINAYSASTDRWKNNGFNSHKRCIHLLCPSYFTFTVKTSTPHCNKQQRNRLTLPLPPITPRTAHTLTGIVFA